MRISELTRQKKVEGSRHYLGHFHACSASQNQCGRWIFHAADPLMEMTTEPNWTNKRGVRGASRSRPRTYKKSCCRLAALLSFAAKQIFSPKSKTREIVIDGRDN